MGSNENQAPQQRKKKEYIVQAWIDEDLLNKLEEIAEKYGLTKAVIIRQGIKMFIKNL